MLRAWRPCSALSALLSVVPASVLPAAVVASLCGCASTPVGPGHLAVEGDRYEDAFAAACEVLRAQGLAPEVVDGRTGRIETGPRYAPSLVEPWGWGEVTASEALEGTLAFERRRARVEFMSAAGGPLAPDAAAPLVGPLLPGADREGPADLAESLARTPVEALEMRVTVSVERQFRPGKQSSPYTRAFGGYARDVTTPDPPGAPRDRSVWTPVARDERLERAIVAEIERRLASVGR
jgi:hypothetical protein